MVFLPLLHGVIILRRQSGRILEIIWQNCRKYSLRTSIWLLGRPQRQLCWHLWNSLWVYAVAYGYTADGICLGSPHTHTTFPSIHFHFSTRHMHTQSLDPLYMHLVQSLNIRGRSSNFRRLFACSSCTRKRITILHSYHCFDVHSNCSIFAGFFLTLLLCIIFLSLLWMVSTLQDWLHFIQGTQHKCINDFFIYLYFIFCQACQPWHRLNYAIQQQQEEQE